MAGQVKVNQLQLGDSSTATQNFVLQTNVDGSAKLARGNAGATTQDILTVDASGLVTLNQGKQLTLGTAQNSTSGTSIDFTGIPSWVKRITVMFDGVSTNGTSTLIIQIGSGSPETSGYVGSSIQSSSAATPSGNNLSSGFIAELAANAAAIRYGVISICSISLNKWVASGVVGRSDVASITAIGGIKTLSGTLDRIRITTSNGTDTFDAGSINILYEG